MVSDGLAPGTECSECTRLRRELDAALARIAALEAQVRELLAQVRRMGRVGLEVVECLFADWWAFRRGELDRPGLQSRLDPIARELQGVLEQGCSCADSKAATFCANILAVYPALWLFAAIEGVEPTNNHAERILRLGVLWRKNAFGCHSAAGCRFVERMLTVVQTLRLQERPVLDYLHRAIVAHRAGLPAPQLLSQDGN
jgi:transposase